jgi:hypothetical protein
MKINRQVSLAATTALALVSFTGLADAASHREAPLIALDPSADNTDTYAFVSYDEDNLKRDPAQRRVTFILNVIPGQDPADGPNYFAFDDKVRYRINIDNNRDGVADDVIYEVKFATETRPISGALNFPLPYVGNPSIPDPSLQGITDLDGPGATGLTRRQTYTVTEIRGKIRRELFSDQMLIAVPSNVGPATMPNYEVLAAQGVYEDTRTGVRVFAGQRAETFYIDLGAFFDTVNLRRAVPSLTPEEDANDGANPFGVNRFTGANVNTIAIEVPAGRILDRRPREGERSPVIGMYASTGRLQNLSRVRGTDDNDAQSLEARGTLVQVSRLANPLINELIIDTPMKDAWNAAEPEDEAQFESFYKNPSVALALSLIFPLPVPPTPRTDLVQTFLKYPGQPLDGGNCGRPCSELLRLDLSVPPTAAEQQKRLGGLAGDPAGFPNGRRPNDDVTDIAMRVVGGEQYANLRIGFLQGAPGAGVNDGPGYGAVGGNRLDVTTTGIAKEFPFLPTPYDGRNRRHIDCGEPGGNACDEVAAGSAKSR